MNPEHKQVEYKKYFEGKKITKQGFGILGRGIGVVKFLLESGAQVLVTDTKPESDFLENIKEVTNFMLEKNILSSKVSYVFGEHRMQDFLECDYVVQASGVSKDNIYLKHARDNNVKVYQESSLFCEIIREFNNKEISQENFNKIEEKKVSSENINKISIIGITGTRGKTTTTFLIKKIIEDYINNENEKNKNLKDVNKSPDLKLDRKVYFGGNVQGVATLENLKYIKGGDVVVMELDSWILQGFKDINYSPEIAVFTTFMADHMNYYKGDMQDYFLDKANIFLYQKSGDIFITTDKIEVDIKKYLNENDYLEFENRKTDQEDKTQTNKKEYSQKEVEENKKLVILSDSEIGNHNKKYKSLLIGEHNKINVALAISTCRAFGVDDVSIQESLDSFTGVAGRLELVRKLEISPNNFIYFYNDTTATTPDALIVALASLALIAEQNNSQIILICGGRDKELDMTPAAEKIVEFKKENKIKQIILLSDTTTTGTKKLIELFKNIKGNKDSENKYSEIGVNNLSVENEEGGFVDYTECESLELAVQAARSAAAPSDIILFSPGFASFGMFQNEYDRGDKFNKLVNSL